MVLKLPKFEGEARGQGLFMAINPWLLQFMLFSQADWFSGSVATTNNMVTKL